MEGEYDDFHGGNDDQLATTLAHLEGLMEQPAPLENEEEKELARVRALRQELGLPEQSPLLYEPPTEEQKRAVLDPFFEKRLHAKLAEHGGFIDRNKAMVEQLRSGSTSRIGKAVELATQGLERMGIRQPREYVGVFANRSLIGSDIRHLRDIATLSRIGLSPEQLGNAIDRLRTLGFDISSPGALTTALDSDLKFMTYLYSFATTDEEVFQQLCEDLNPYYFLRLRETIHPPLTDSDEENWPKLNRNIRFFSQLVQDGLQPKYQARLEAELQRRLLGVDGSQNYEEPNYYNIDGLFTAHPETFTNRVTAAKDLVFQWIAEEKIPEDQIMFHHRFFETPRDRDYNNDDEQADIYDDISLLVNNGIQISFEDGADLQSQTWEKATLEYAISAAARIAPSKAQRAWVAFIQEMRNESMISGVYPTQLEGLYEQRTKFENFAIVFDALSDYTVLPASEVIPRGKIGETLDLQPLAGRINQYISSGGSEDTDNPTFITAAELFLSTNGILSLTEHDLPALAFLAKNKEDLSRYIARGRKMVREYFIRASLIEAAAAGQFETDASVRKKIFQHYYFGCSVMEHWERVSDDTILRFHEDIELTRLADEVAVMSLEDMHTSPYLTSAEKKVFLAAQKYTQFGSFIFGQADRIDDFFIDGKPTHTFFIATAVTDMINVADICHVIEHEPDILDAFSESERAFWQIAKEQSLKDVSDISFAIQRGLITTDLANIFFSKATGLQDTEFAAVKSYIISNIDVLIGDPADIQFINALAGRFGKKVDNILQGYVACLKAGTITLADKALVSEFLDQFRVLSPQIIAGYKEAKATGYAEVYVAQLKSNAEKMTGAAVITDEERHHPYYQDLLHHVYTNNAGSYGGFEKAAACTDRGSDLAEFTVQPRYEIDLLSQSVIRLKEGEVTDEAAKKSLQDQVYDVAKFMEEHGHNKDKILGLLAKDVDDQLVAMQQTGRLADVDLSGLTTLDEKLFLLLIEHTYGEPLDHALVKRLLITYEFAMFEDITDYIQGTNDRVSKSNNPDYALFCELSTFYADRIKEVNRRLVRAGFESSVTVPLMKQYFGELSTGTVARQRQDQISRFRPDRLALSDSFIQQIKRTLEQRRQGRKYTDDEVKRMISLYETFAGGLVEKKSTSPDTETQAFYGQLSSQREKTFNALAVINGEAVNPSGIHLGEINLAQALETETAIREGIYDEQQFAAYTAQRFVGIFADEQATVNSELAKFESESGKAREVVYGYITKTKESAYARMVGGVCVAGDAQMWDMPNYFQLVLQDPDTLQCQGLVLLHCFQDPEDPNKQVLTASFNPSQTYLYTVDEQALFKGLTSVLKQFANENNIDRIVVSQNKSIRTNRTGGQFEQAIDRSVAAYNLPFSFTEPVTFSFTPSYNMQEMDTLYQRAADRA